jgi:hypothetical protein
MQVLQDLISRAHSSTFNLAPPWTIEGWLYVFATDRSSYCWVLGKGDNNTAYQLQLDDDSNPKKLVFRMKVSGVSKDVSTTGGVARDAWFHFAVRYDNANLQLVINGAQVATLGVSGSPDTNSGPFQLGDDASSENHVFSGLVYDLRLWNTFRSDGQINANKGTLIANSTSGLVANWLFDEGIGLVAEDRVGSLDLTVRNSHQWSNGRGRPY